MTQNYTTVVGESAAIAAARAEIERLTKERDFLIQAAKDVGASFRKAMERAEKAEVEAEFFKSEIKLRNRIPSTNDTAADLLRRAEKAEAERDEARAQVAAAYEAAAEKCDVVFQDGVGDLIRGIGDEIRALAPADAKAALEAYGREKVREGMQHMLNRLQHEGQINPSLTYADAIEWAKNIRDDMEKLNVRT